MPAVIDYLHPDLPPGLARVTMRVIDATPASLEGYGCLVDDPASCRIKRSCAGRRKARGPSTSTRATRAGRPKARSSANGRGTSCSAATTPSGAVHPRVRRGSPVAPTPVTRAIRGGYSSGTRTTIRTAASSSSRSKGSRSWCRSHCRATTSSLQDSCASASTARAASTFIRTSGTRACSPRPGRSASSTSRARCTRAFRSISRASSDAFLEAPID